MPAIYPELFMSMQRSLAALSVLSISAASAMGQCTVSFSPDGPQVAAPGSNFPLIGEVGNGGNQDLIVTSTFSTGAVRVAWNISPLPSTWPVNDYGSLNFGSYPLVGRLNADELPDILVSTGSGLRVVYGTGGGFFGAPVTLTSNTNCRQNVIADLNADGLNDVVVVSSAAPFVQVVLNNGNGTFTASTQTYAGSNAWGAGVIDADGDGIKDLMVNVTGTGGLYFLKGNGNGTFQPSIVAAAGVGGAGIATGDLNGDGRQDVAIVNQGNLRVYILLSNGNGTFTVSPPVLLPATPGTVVALQDMDGDGFLDVVTSVTNVGVYTYRGLGNGTFSASPSFVAVTGTNLFGVGDYSGDGRPDLAVSLLTGGVQMFRNTTLNSVIVQQPAPVTVAELGTANFSITHATSSPTFVWRRNGVPLTNGGHYSGVDTYSLTVSSVTDLEAGNYDCIVTGPCDSETSAAAALTVTSGCGSPDFNGDGDFGTDADIEAFFRVLAGGNC